MTTFEWIIAILLGVGSLSLAGFFIWLGIKGYQDSKSVDVTERTAQGFSKAFAEHNL